MGKTMKVDGQFTVQKSHVGQVNLQKRSIQSFFDSDLNNSSYHCLFSASSTTRSTLTGTRLSYADIVRDTNKKTHPPVKIEPKTSDKQNISSEIAQDPLLPKSC